VGWRGRGGPVLSAEGAKGEVRIQEPSPSERSVARRAAEARATVPDLELTLTTESEVPPSTARLVRACALALTEHPRANAAYRDGRFELYSRVNVGVVVADADTYLIPTVFDADRKPLAELEAELERLAAQARAAQLAAPAYTGATFTLWNAGEHGVAAASLPVIPPQAAVLAAGTAALTLCCDHRILYGGAAVAFLQAIAHHLDRDGV
jgi:pyruvate dehydrogenase E2 component (dihydrolipoamide acetyltransferase)